MTVTRTFRRRIDYQLLRWQARLDGAWADRVIPLVAMAGLFLLLAGEALARARSLETGGDLAAWVQGAWQITTGRTAESTITGRHLLEPQFAVGFYGIAQLTRVVTPVALLLTDPSTPYGRMFEALGAVQQSPINRYSMQLAEEAGTDR